jgi:hypothetical protein
MDMKSARNPQAGSARTLLIAGIALVVIVAAIVGARMMMGGGPAEKKATLDFHKGMGYVTWSEEGYLSAFSDDSLAKLREIGTSWVSIHTTWYQTNTWSGDIQMTPKTPSDESVVHAIRKAHDLGMKVMIKPHLDLLDKSDGSWRGEIGSLREEEWERWFAEYTKFIMHYIKIANAENVEGFCIGTELSTAATVKGYMWRDLIGKIRSKYDGHLTYAAHWDVYQDIRFWDLLDYVGINAYFPLTNELDPTYEQLVNGWAQWVDQMEQFQQEVQKPIIFPEIGCASADGAAIRPWEHFQRTEVNLRLQADYYRAIFDVFWQKPWFYGMHWWYWGTNVRMGGEYNRGFLPQNKPAQDVVEKWYTKPDPR